MKPETKTCQNCKKDFIIESDDFLFYEKIKVPPPTFCPECRFVRRMIWRNERSLYKRKCDMCGKNIIAMYDDKVDFSVYCPECWKSDKWGAETYLQDYDFSKSFFEQYNNLFKKIPRVSLYTQGNCIGCDYANVLLDSKNIYLSFSVILKSEDIFYSNNIDKSKMIIDSYNISKSELLYENTSVNKNYNCQYSYWSSNCINCNFVLDCNNCQDCFGCVNLRNKQYYIWNKQHTREEYEKKIKKFNIGSYKFIKKTYKDFWLFSLKFPRKYANIINCVNSTGNELSNNNSNLKTFNSYDSDNLKYCYRCVKEKDAMDVSYNLGASLVYEHITGATSGYNIKFVSNGNSDLRGITYSDSCQSSSNLFGCIGLKNKQYCILNKQYTKEQYEELIPKIKQHMNDMPYIDKKGNIYKYGEFFPFELCPFGYNESAINDFSPLSKEEILEKGYKYKEKQNNKYNITLKAKDIPDDIKDVNDLILNEVIECEKSNKVFKLTSFELQFYRRMNIPIPRVHPDERYKERMKLRNPLKLWHRQCMCKQDDHTHKGRCPIEFETSYSPEREEIVYCKDCYQKEVY